MLPFSGHRESTIYRVHKCYVQSRTMEPPLYHWVACVTRFLICTVANCKVVLLFNVLLRKLKKFNDWRRLNQTTNIPGSGRVCMNCGSGGVLNCLTDWYIILLEISISYSQRIKFRKSTLQFDSTNYVPINAHNNNAKKSLCKFTCIFYMHTSLSALVTYTMKSTERGKSAVLSIFCVSR